MGKKPTRTQIYWNRFESYVAYLHYYQAGNSYTLEYTKSFDDDERYPCYYLKKLTSSNLGSDFELLISLDENGNKETKRFKTI